MDAYTYSFKQIYLFLNCFPVKKNQFGLNQTGLLKSDSVLINKRMLKFPLLGFFLESPPSHVLYYFADEQSDSEESNAAGGVHLEKNYQNQKSFYSRFTFSSQSTPTRRYNHDIKSTRSSSTASETKVTFNEGKEKEIAPSSFNVICYL